MTDYGRGGNYRPDDTEKYVLGRDGTPLVDRYGRPVRRRPETQAPQTRRLTAKHPPQRRPRREVPPVEPASPPPGDQVHIAPRPQPQPRPRRRRRGIGCFGIVGWAVAIIAVLAIVVTLWADARLTRVDATPEQPIANTAGTNWLIVGSDSRQGLTEEEAAALGTGGDLGVGRTDTIMLLHMPRGGGDATLVSIPRDSLVTIPGYGENKINAAFAFGGPQLLVATVEQSTGLSIDHYAEIGMGGLANLVDAVGGIEICVAEPIQDPLANLDVQAGCQPMDGVTALGYVRTRATAQGDLDRVERQRQFFAALITELTEPATLLNPLNMGRLVEGATASFIVGEGDHVWHLARLALTMRGGIHNETVPIAGFADTGVGNVVIWDQAGSEALWSAMR